MSCAYTKDECPGFVGYPRTPFLTGFVERSLFLNMKKLLRNGSRVKLVPADAPSDHLPAGKLFEIRHPHMHEIETPGATMNGRLMSAIYTGFAHRVDYLVKHGADPNYISNGTPLVNLATLVALLTDDNMDRAGVVRVLVESGAHLDVADTTGRTPLDWCIRLGGERAGLLQQILSVAAGTQS